jgi:hypothetical protein
VQPALAVTTTSLPDGWTGSPYTATLAASGGSPPVEWSISSGALPAGLGLTPDGQITGNPQPVGTVTFTVQAADTAGHTATATLSITVRERLADPVPALGLPGTVLLAAFLGLLAALALRKA